MRCIKRALDPHWLMNPGKIFDVSAADLRGTGTAVAAVATARHTRDDALAGVEPRKKKHDAAGAAGADLPHPEQQRDIVARA